VREADVCVLGGSCTGVFAAVRAARLGMRVVLIERENMLGGAAAFLVAVGLALKGKSLLVVSLGSSAAVLATEFLLTFIF
jgi:glycine/D-amino acid oxidase-like deaminating enzyme